MLDHGRYVPTKFAADAVGVSARTIRDWVADGKIEGYRIGQHKIVVDLDDALGMIKPANKRPLEKLRNN